MHSAEKENILRIDFLITQNCNYRCEYCSQSKKYAANRQDNATDETIAAFLHFLDGLDRHFEVTISGGEPFCHKKFFYLVEEIIKRNGDISIVSNFSFEIENYKKLKDIAGDNLKEVLVSLHLSQVKSLDEFLKKAEIFNSYKGNTRFKIASVLADENVYELKKVNEFLKSKNIEFELQHMRIGNKFVEYKDEAKEFIKDFPISKIKEKSNSYGKMCRAGADFIFIYQNGEAYRCYSSRFNKIHSMGNIKDKNFKLFKKAIPCLNKNCTCPKPIMYNMIDFDNEKLPLAFLYSMYNALFLPYYCVKNYGAIKSKLKQIINFKNKS